MSDNMRIHPTLHAALETAVGAAELNAETIREQQRQWSVEVNRLHANIRDLEHLQVLACTLLSIQASELADARTERDHERNLRRTIMETLENTVVEIVPLRNRVTKMITIDAILEDSQTYCRDLCSCRHPECDGPDSHDDKAPTSGGTRS